MDNPYISVLVLEYIKKPKIVEGLVAKTQDGGFSLTPHNINLEDKSLKIKGKSRNGTVPEYLEVNSTKILKWKIYIDNPGEKTIDISYSCQNEQNIGQVKIKGANYKLTQNIRNTGKTVGEPNQDWVIDNFKSQKLGNISFPKSDFYEIELEITPEKKKEIKFQWIWIK